MCPLWLMQISKPVCTYIIINYHWIDDTFSQIFCLGIKIPQRRWVYWLIVSGREKMKRTLASGPKREKRVCSISFNTVSGYSSPSQRVKFTSEDGLLSAAIQGKTEVLSIHACHLEPQLTFKTLLINFSAILFDSPNCMRLSFPNGLYHLCRRRRYWTTGFIYNHSSGI